MVKQISSKQWKVESDSRKGMYHTITMQDEKNFTCTCEDFQFNSKKKPRFKCKHIVQVKMWRYREKKDEEK